MLAIPAKRTDSADYAKALRDFFHKKFPKDIAHFENDIISFQQLRSAATSVTDAHDQIGQQQLMRYHYHLSVMVSRLYDLESEMKLSFSWYDAYRPSRRFTSGNLYYEWACSLWNMAAFESTRAARVDRSSEEGIRQASRGFQQAAGIFHHIAENMIPKISTALSPDLTSESLQMSKQVHQYCWLLSYLS
jgi:programmed cell death 6-interacting protein